MEEMMMEKQMILERLARIRKEAGMLAEKLDALQKMGPGFSPEARKLSLDTSLLAERTACSIRNLVFDTGQISRRRLLLQSAHAQEVQVSHSDGIVTIRLPGLLPKRNGRINTAFLTDPLYACLEEYEKEHPLPRFRSCAVCFLHIFDRSLPSRRVRDYDNLECKQLLDTAAAFLMTDDGSLLCDLYHTTRFGENDCTLLILMDKSRFPAWLAGPKTLGNGPETISDFF